ncbi:hypothetical protein SCHPADRAFT_422303 [Schizopora paradoxa]|uniref:Uncharacterized protein n=1 Tax=Schizopora paradoxa TaxID=27342 RepID=A0A0H2RSE2_9AGAM|nr:hypothetical protein SCHPADRAFT_422303 [Schizopora paradoxa]
MSLQNIFSSSEGEKKVCRVLFLRFQRQKVSKAVLGGGCAISFVFALRDRFVVDLESKQPCRPSISWSSRHGKQQQCELLSSHKNAQHSVRQPWQKLQEFTDLQRGLCRNRNCYLARPSIMRRLRSI